MRLACVSLCAVLVFACGCGDSDPSGTSTSSKTVKPGDSIQAAVDKAAPGDTITVLPGDYTESHSSGEAALRITKPLKLIAQSTASAKVRILPSTGQKHGILVEPKNEGDPAPKKRGKTAKTR